jgi:hypothetical protein
MALHIRKPCQFLGSSITINRTLIWGQKMKSLYTSLNVHINSFKIRDIVDFPTIKSSLQVRKLAPCELIYKLHNIHKFL